MLIINLPFHCWGCTAPQNSSALCKEQSPAGAVKHLENLSAFSFSKMETSDREMSDIDSNVYLCPAENDKCFSK